QDTSPIQLALFMELAQLVDDVVWVGDRKQAIYGFRGADPELMNDVFSSLIDGSSGLGTAQTENLGYSWRSSQAPLELSNTLFRSVFADQPEEEVVLTIPPQREARRHEGGRELWVPDTDKGKDARAGSRLTTTIADGIVDFLQRAPQLPVSSGEAGTGGGAASGAAPVTHRAVEPGNIAVLVRSNSEVARVVDGLLERGVPATGSAVALLQTREGQYVRAGLAAVVDSSDTVALAELVTLLPDHARRETWFEDAVRIVERDERRAHPHTWWEDETLHALDSLRGRVSDVSPSQLLVEVIDALDLPQRIKGWSAPETRLANLDGLRQLALEYEESARSTRTPVSAAGLLAHLTDVGDEYSDATAHDAVLVTTMHQSKGLQWPVVVTGIPQSRDWGHKVVSVQKAEAFDVLKPLDGRSIRFLPRVLDGYDELKERLDGSAVVSAGKVAERRESARLYYVGLTRAELYSIAAFAYPDGQGNALGEAIDSDVPLLEWDVPEPGTAAGEVRVNNLRVGEAAGPGLAGTNLAVTMRMSAVGDEPRVLEREQVVSAYAYTDVPLRRPPARDDLFPARFTASSAPSEGIDADIRVVAKLGEPLIAKGGVDWDVVGDAVHAYLGIPHQVLPLAMAREAAQQIVDRWVVGNVVGADVLVEAGARWARWVEATYPGAEILTEQPIAWRNEFHQVMEGWIDTRIMLADGGHVLVDHKSYPGVDPVGHVRENYVGQLAAYAA
ncbi:MAG: UvrD-helicase domain-containing protein, partial [Brachybacterium sp.]